MQKKIEDISTTSKRFTVEVPAEEMESSMVDALRRIGRNVRLPGFRPGKAPLSLLYKKFGEDVEAEVLEKAVAKNYLQLVKEEGIVPVTAPAFEEYNFKRNSPLKMVFTVEIRPEINDLTYDGFNVRVEEIEVTEEDVENTLSNILAERSTYEKVDDAAAIDDQVTVDFVTGDGEEHKDQYLLVGYGSMPEEMTDGLKDRKAGDAFDITADFPENFINRTLAGKSESLKGTITEVKRLKRPELTEKFAKDLGLESIDKLKEAVKESLLRAKEGELKNSQKSEIIEQLVGSHDFDLPQSLLDEEINMLVAQEKTKDADADEERLREESQEKAARKVKADILLDMIAEKESVSVSDDELKAQISATANSMYLSPENFMKQYLPNENAMGIFRQNIIREKTVDVILQKALDITEAPQEKEGEKEVNEADSKGEEE